MKKVSLFYGFAHPFSVWLNKRQPNPHICFCTQSVSISCFWLKHMKNIWPQGVPRAIKEAAWPPPLPVPPDLSLASLVFGQNRPRDASYHFPTSFPVTTLGTTSVMLSVRDQPTPFLELNSLLLNNRELPDSSGLCL